ncbi:RNA ligase partner protein [Thermodesulfovibrio yellowstonii]|uniref:RNA ligase partner protein n=1 Tax=Thermodesulfovibrio yellowstonii TaxID=28262 RepID=UPI0024B3B285|nr:RNA ligase partner protein [Thermodesulfovibrio yellowstonii]MDI6864621.1 RNA ligase partner protein [Thermodesulfovibrio yellowstonii]
MINFFRKKRKIVLDTSVFINPDIRNFFGENPEQAIEEFIKIAKRAKNLEFYIPSTVFKELMYFVDEKKIPKDFYFLIRIKSPDKHRSVCPAIFFYELVEEMRQRINKGLRVAENAVRNVNQKDADEIIKDLRKKYREALREGIIDSKEDVDLIFLSMELQATLITGDQGLIKWADKLGIEWIVPEKFKDFLLSAIG